jgi:ESCRT-II complex subunit VPS25
MTFYEITEGDLSHTTGRFPPLLYRYLLLMKWVCLVEFYELPVPILRKALDTLVKTRRAQLLKGEGEDGDGVRFL